MTSLMAHLAEIAARDRAWSEGYEECRRRSRLKLWVAVAAGALGAVLFDSVVNQILGR